MENYKDIHIGSIIKELVSAKEIQMTRIENFFKKSEEEILEMYTQKSIDSELLLRWCKLLEYNLFMYYHSHLQLYSPVASTAKAKNQNESEDRVQTFNKNIYTEEVKEFILSLIRENKMTKTKAIQRYNIPKVTLYTWLRKSGTATEPPKKKVLA